MNEQVKAFVAAVKANEEEKALEIAAGIVSVLLNDVRRIADAIEQIAKRNS